MEATAAELVLIVDNASLLRALLEGVAARKRLDQLRVLSSPQEAREILKDGNVVHIYSDWKMPGADGIEFLNDVKATYPELGCSLLTGWPDDLPEHERVALRSRGIDIVAKDCISEEWLVRVCAKGGEDVGQSNEMTRPTDEDPEEQVSAMEALATVRLELAQESARSDRRREALAKMSEPLVEQLRVLGSQGDGGLFGFGEKLTVDDLIVHITEQTPFGVRVLEIDRLMQDER